MQALQPGILVPSCEFRFGGSTSLSTRELAVIDQLNLLYLENPIHHQQAVCLNKKENMINADKQLILATAAGPNGSSRGGSMSHPDSPAGRIA